MDKKGQNGSLYEQTGGRLCRHGILSATALKAVGEADRRARQVARKKGTVGQNPTSGRIGTTDTPVQPNLLLEYRNQPRLSDGANITILKNEMVEKLVEKRTNIYSKKTVRRLLIS